MSTPREELLQAVHDQGVASTKLRHAEIRRWGPFGALAVRRARKNLRDARQKVSDSFDAWERSLDNLSIEDFDGCRAEEDMR